ncbi:hypothetical protein NECAME_00134 [Necator americanus]|uniref:Uncharacterized protein n=1 Tax=Necator americanus TaxID=51031 RepID=W2TYZ7_NECAM|nr:hypothetical protein NECAME_00134 [Necator americanus]ETN87275.1 hypothetical protein NECAME_00134 [Necator americanus]
MADSSPGSFYRLYTCTVHYSPLINHSRVVQVLKDLGEVVIVDLEDKTLQSAHNDVADVPNEVRQLRLETILKRVLCSSSACSFSCSFPGNNISQESVEELFRYGRLNVKKLSSRECSAFWWIQDGFCSQRVYRDRSLGQREICAGAKAIFPTVSVLTYWY